MKPDNWIESDEWDVTCEEIAGLADCAEYDEEDADGTCTAANTEGYDFDPERDVPVDACRVCGVPIPGGDLYCEACESPGKRNPS
jgi:hypothetical protein